MEFPTKWRKPHHSNSICLEMTCEIRLLPHGENGGKVALLILSFSAMSCHRQLVQNAAAMQKWHNLNHGIKLKPGLEIIRS